MKNKKKVSRVYITNLGKYNEGELLGEWLELPASESNYKQTLKNIGIDGVNYEEYFITDWEYMPKFMAEHITDLNKLNGMASTMTAVFEKIGYDWLESDYLEGDYNFIVNSLSDYELYNNCDNFNEMIETINNCQIFKGLKDYGEYLLEECNYLDYWALDNDVKSYIDAEQLAFDTYLNESVIATKVLNHPRDVQILITER